MNADLKKGMLSVNLYDVFESLSPEELIELVDSLACTDAVIKHVADQIIDGWTELGSHGGKSAGNHTAYGALDEAIRRVAEASGEVAKKEIAALCDSLKRVEQQNVDAWVEIRRLQDKWRTA